MDDITTILKLIQQLKATLQQTEMALYDGVPSQDVAEGLRAQMDGAKHRLQVVRDWFDNIGR